jgi:hypothetical protein
MNVPELVSLRPFFETEKCWLRYLCRLTMPAFAAVALVLLVVATALALGRDRYRGGAQGMREGLAHWD